MKTLVRAAVAAIAALGPLLDASPAEAQATPLPEFVSIGSWRFRPSLEARLRGEYRTEPFDTNLPTAFGGGAVLADAYNSNLPERRLLYALPSDEQGWLVAERVRLGLAVDRGPVTAAVTLQDARLITTGGDTSRFFMTSPRLPGTGFVPYEAYIDVHSRSGGQMFLRLGRQKVVWGDGRLIGGNDFTATGQSLDAGRFMVQLGDFDIEALAAVLGLGLGATPGQLYGLNLKWNVFSLLHIEATGLARFARSTTGTSAGALGALGEGAGAFLTPSDTYVIDGRLFGKNRGFRYNLEGAYELGRVASYGTLRDLQAFAFAGRFEWETALPGHLTLGAQGAYASGDKGTGDPNEPMTRFDPILPDQYANHGAMGLYAWSNLIEAGGDVSVRPVEEFQIRAGYRFVGLADPKGRWISASLLTIGAAPENESNDLGHEIDMRLRLTPWEPITFEGGYGLFLLGDGGKAILATAGRATELQHWAYLQATVRAP